MHGYRISYQALMFVLDDNLEGVVSVFVYIHCICSTYNMDNPDHPYL